jgi:hypothetical protein
VHQPLSDSERRLTRLGHGLSKLTTIFAEMSYQPDQLDREGVTPPVREDAPAAFVRLATATVTET